MGTGGRFFYFKNSKNSIRERAVYSTGEGIRMIFILQ